MKNFNQQQGEMDSSEFYKDVANHGSANFNGNQAQAHKIGSQTAKQGVNWVMSQPDDKGDSTWEKSQGVFMDVGGTFKDINEKMHYEVDLKNDSSGGIGLHEKDMGDCKGY